MLTLIRKAITACPHRGPRRLTAALDELLGGRNFRLLNRDHSRACIRARPRLNSSYARDIVHRLDGCRLLSPALAAQNNVFGPGDPYQACVAAIDMDPMDAFERAHRWRAQGGGVQADHAPPRRSRSPLDEPGKLLRVLDILARRSDAEHVEERAALLAEAGNAWLLAAPTANAGLLLSAALKLSPRDPICGPIARSRAVPRRSTGPTRKRPNNALTLDARNPKCSCCALRPAPRRATRSARNST